MSASDAQLLHDRIEEPEPRKPIVLPEDEAIQAVRDQLRAAKARIEDEMGGLIAESGQSAYELRRFALNRGRLIAALDDAENGLFRVLVIASCYTHCFAAEHVLDVDTQDLTPEQTEAGFALIAASVGAVDRDGRIALVK